VLPRPLGTTGLSVTPLVVGAPRAPLPVARGVELLGEGWDALGIRALDVGDLGADGETAAERFLEERQPEDAAVLAGIGAAVDPERGSDLSPARLQRELAAGIRRIGRIDGAWLRGADAFTPLEATLTVLASAMEAGSLVGYGLADTDVWTLERTLTAADRAGLPRPSWIRNRMNLLERGDERDLLPLASGEGLGATPRAPFAHGRLTDRFVEAEEAAERAAAAGVARTAPADPALAALRRLRDLAREREVGTQALALGWLMGAPGVTAPIVAPRNAGEWDAAHEAVALEVDPELREQLDALFA
jgi:aryl-alcohol dehydrogenase-like predicted oxidoreductase